jgi:hypothetical protein
MKSKSLLLMLVLMVAAWAQVSNVSQTNAPQKAQCACCDKTGSATAKEACMRHMAKSADGKDMDSCCAGKSGKSCCENKAESCMKCDKGKGWCGDCGKEKDKAATPCCGHACETASGAKDSGKGRCCGRAAL